MSSDVTDLAEPSTNIRKSRRVADFQAPTGIGRYRWLVVSRRVLRCAEVVADGRAGMEESLCELTLGSDEFVDDLALRRQ